MGIKLFAFFDSLIICQKLTDPTSGFRAYGKKTINFFVKPYQECSIERKYGDKPSQTTETEVKITL